MIEGKNIVIGVTGGVAIYKALEVISLLKKKNAHVRVVQTEDSTKFISPLLFECLTNSPVFSDIFKSDFISSSPVPTSTTHINWASWADALVIVPATANIIARIAHGIADDPVSLLALATKAKKLCVPAMHGDMYGNPATQENIRKLIERGWKILEPKEGKLACGSYGKGHITEEDVIVDAIEDLFCEKIFSGWKVVVTAGPTREYMDPVRFISNPSSGMMGFCLASVAAKMGGDITLISGYTHLSPSYNVKNFIEVEDTEQMRDEVIKELEDKRTLLLMAAAVSNFKPKERFSQKIKKKERMILELVQTEDILKTVRGVVEERRLPVKMVGFAAETEHVEQNARKKIEEKGLWACVVNDVSRNDIGFSSPYNEVDIIFKDGRKVHIEKDVKEKVAYNILKEIKDAIED
ncbi:MAG: bifunctional phosphopantothenoylcysteine decarboxylase/phosphopantothenate--cysteine ligase CoaBC [Deltaproteobacteria bacterium]|nr:bifunctional phosphopantothenoylcysteine decarboxylase/phosphopantothenate--cysteine ligase CoaBC [Deltaproteobacteria bacterium]